MDVSSLSGTSGTIDYAKKRQEMFANIDTDGNGTVSLEEFSVNKPADAPADGPDASEIFASIDTNGDGVLSEEEMANMPPPPSPPSGGSSLMSSDTLSTLLQVLEEDDSSDEESAESMLAAVSEETDETEETAEVEENVLELIQEGINAHQSASEAYASAQTAAMMIPGMQSYIVS